MYSERFVEHLITESGVVLASIVERQMHSGKTVYYGRFKVQKAHLANNQKYIVRSLKTDDLDAARTKAHEHFALLKVRSDNEVHLKSLTVNTCIDRFLRNYESGLDNGVSGYTQNMFRGFKKSVDIHWRDYLGERQLNSISATDLEGYELWRRDFAKSSSKRKKQDKRYKTDLAPRTIHWEVNAFKQVLRWGAGKGIYNGRAYEWKFRSEKNRRSAFTLEQYRTLHRYMRTNTFLYRGKHRTDQRIIRHRTLLRAYILFMANTGLRIGEARHLRWSDISERTNKLGSRVLVVRVSEDKSKVRKSNSTYGNVIGRFTALRALERWKAYLVESGEGWAKDSYIFCNPAGKPIDSFRVGFNSVTQEAGVECDEDGNRHTIYTLRHTYITFRLQYGKGLSIHSLAKNCRTSVAMIEQFYSDAVSEDFVDELSV